MGGGEGGCTDVLGHRACGVQLAPGLTEVGVRLTRERWASVGADW